jgi:hypothetical protein
MKLIYCASFLAALLACSSASADASSSARASNLRVTLIDLNLDDGITPSITFNTASTDHASRTSMERREVPEGGTEVYLRDEDEGAGMFGPVSSDASEGVSRAFASVSSDGGLEGLALYAEGSGLTSEGVTRTYSGGATVLWNEANGYAANAFRLSANTRAVFTVDVNLTAKLSLASPTTLFHSAHADAGLTVWDQADGDGHGPQYNGFVARLEDWVWFDGTPASGGAGFIQQRTLTAQLDNLTAGWMEGGAALSVSVRGAIPPPAPVPEPSGIASLVAGIGVLALRTRWKPRKRLTQGRCSAAR